MNVYKYSNTSHPSFYVPEITSGMRRQQSLQIPSPIFDPENGLWNSEALKDLFKCLLTIAKYFRLLSGGLCFFQQGAEKVSWC